MFSNVSTVDKRQTSQCWWMHNQLLSQTVRAMCLAYERAAVIHHRASPLADYILLCVRRHVSSFQKLECALATDEGNNTHTHTHRLFTRSFFISRALTLFRCRRRTRSFVHSIVCRQQICEMRAHAIYQHCAIPVSASVAVRQRQQQHDANGSARRLCRSGRRIIGSHRCFASYGDFHFHKFTVVFRRRHSAHHNHTYLHRVT